jgi:uracil-DNA glycosylase family 4
MNTKKALSVLKEEWTNCARCRLSSLRVQEEHVVLGGGAIPADYLFIYDAPEAEDMQYGTPVQGKLGSILEGLVTQARFPENSFCYAPLVGCRPYLVLPATEETLEQVRDRDPSRDEIASCRPRIDSIIYMTDPRLIFAVGEETWTTLVAPKDREGATTLSGAAGQLYFTYIQGKSRTLRYPVMPLLPPKQIIANPSSADHGPIKTTIEAMVRAKFYVAELLKEKR